MKPQAVTMAMLLSVCSVAIAAPRQSHFWLCANHDWSAKTGYFLIVENTFDDGAPSKLADARLVLAVGDRHDFRYLRAPANFERGREYSAKATISDQSAELWIDGKRVAASDGAFVPCAQLQANTMPS